MMTVFQVLKGVGCEKRFAGLITGLVKQTSSAEELEDCLKRELTEEDLQIIFSAIQNGYPISLGKKQNFETIGKEGISNHALDYEGYEETAMISLKVLDTIVENTQDLPISEALVILDDAKGLLLQMVRV